MEDSIKMAFAAIDKSIISSIPKQVEVETRGNSFINWGEDNLYPEFLFDLYQSVTTLSTIIEAISDYSVGNDAVCNVAGFERQMNRKGDTANDIIKYLVRDYMLYGCAAVQIIRDKVGRIAEIYYVDMRCLRTDKKNQTFYYSEEYAKKWARKNKVIVYPAFIPDAVDVTTSILMIKNNMTYSYGVPTYTSAIKDCMIEKKIEEMHLNSLDNNFMASYLINFLNGVPTDEQKAEIEKNIQEKFTGSENAGRFMLNFANGKDNMAILQKLEITDFADKYNAAATRSREQIFSAFRMIPQVCGVMSESTGFNTQEFQEAFKLVNRTVVRPIQNKITNMFDKVFQTEGSITIEPFNLENNTQTDVE